MSKRHQLSMTDGSQFAKSVSSAELASLNAPMTVGVS